MAWQLGKLFISALVISFSSWLAGRQPRLAGFLLAIPLSTMLALAFTQGEYQDTAKTVDFAKSIFLAVPLSLLFFVPFLLADKLKWNFLMLYGTGVLLLGVGYLVHASVGEAH